MYIETDKPSYYAGETVTGFVVATLFSPQQCDAVVVQVTGKEQVMWDTESSEQIFEGEGEQRKSRTIYHHRQYSGKHIAFRDLVVCSQIPHILAPGTYRYPFVYQLNPNLPGVMKFYSERQSIDPNHRHRPNIFSGRIVCVERVGEGTLYDCVPASFDPPPPTPPPPATRFAPRCNATRVCFLGSSRGSSRWW